MKILMKIAVVLMLCSVLCSCRTQPQPEAHEDPTAAPVQVDMTHYTLTYAGELKDQISYEQLPEKDHLRFYVSLSRGKQPIFTLQWAVAEGELVTMVDGGNGEKIPVSFAMEPIPDDLNEADHTLFCTAQEQVNAIIASIKVK